MNATPRPGPVELAGASSDDELRQILDLQARNLEQRVGPQQAADQGFVTLRHDLGLLREMNDAHPHVVARSGGRVVGYALAMSRAFEDRFPDLAPMFTLLDGARWRGRALGERPVLVMGQVCVDAPFRGTGVFGALYRKMRELYAPRYELLATEISARNARSQRAHARVGFELLARHRDEGGEEWHVVVWEW